MPKSVSAPLTFYPAYCFSLSPTHNTWARLTAADVHALTERAGFEGQNLYFHLNHPIRWIRLVGVIVAVDVYPTRWIMSLDDSSGATIEITCGRQKPAQCTLPVKEAETTGFHDCPMEGHTATGLRIDLRGIDIGNVVKLKGGIGTFRGEKQVLLERISIIRTTNEEATAWAENTNFHMSILDVPWVVNEKDEGRARRQAQGLDREQRAREERRRKRRIELNTTKTLKHRETRQLTVGQRKQKIEEVNCAATEKLMQVHKRKSEERKAREQEFERSRAREAKSRLELDEALRTEKAQLEETQQAFGEAEKQRHEEDPRLAKEIERKYRAKSRRDEERKLREQEFERLKHCKETKETKREKDRPTAV